jgi:hypothetical protein
MHATDDIPLARLTATALAKVGTDDPLDFTQLAQGSDGALPPRAPRPLFQGACDRHCRVLMHRTPARCQRRVGRPLVDRHQRCRHAGLV